MHEPQNGVDLVQYVVAVNCFKLASATVCNHGNVLREVNHQGWCAL
jgi:hypothetical protein